MSPERKNIDEHSRACCRPTAVFGEPGAQYRASRTKNVMFPSLKKYTWCRANDSSAIGLTLREKFVSLAPRSAGCTPVDPVVIMCVSGAIESMETTERELALDRDGETQDSLVLQDTMRGDMVGKVCDPYHINFRLYVRAQGGDVLFTQGPGLKVPALSRAQSLTLIDTHALGPRLSSERTPSE